MSSSIRARALVFCLLALSAIPVVAAAQNGNGNGSAPVTIVGPLPVPVTLSGATSVSGTVAVRDVDNAARSPFQFTLCTSTGFGATPTPSCTNQPTSFQVSGNRRLVIEYMSGECGLGGDANLVRQVLFTTAGGTAAQHPLHLQRDPIDSRFFDIAQQVRIYADPGTTAGIGGSFGGGAGSGSIRCTLTLSGYTVAL